MVKISSGQMRAMEGVAGPNFADGLVSRCFDFAPAHAAAVGREGIGRAVDQGIARAAARGFDQRGPVRFWIDAMLLLGGEFDTDPQFPWIAPVLAAVSPATQLSAADRLHAGVMDYLDAVAGEKGVFALAALRRLSARLRSRDPALAASSPAAMLDLLHALHPEKADHLGAGPLDALVAAARAAAAERGFAAPRQLTLVAVLMFALGHGCLASPLFPWISRTLGDPALADPATRAQRLEARMTTYLDHVIASAETA